MIMRPREREDFGGKFSLNMMKCYLKEVDVVLRMQQSKLVSEAEKTASVRVPLAVTARVGTSGRRLLERLSEIRLEMTSESNWCV